MLLAVTFALALLGTGGERFENPAFGHTVVVPPGWRAQLGPEDRVTSVATYRVPRVDRWERPPPGQVRVTLMDYGRRACPRDATRAGEPVRLIGPASFEGFHGHTAVWCRGGHSLQAFVLHGPSASPARIAQARRLIGSLRLTARAHRAETRTASGSSAERWRDGRSARGASAIRGIHVACSSSAAFTGTPARAWR